MENARDIGELMKEHLKNNGETPSRQLIRMVKSEDESITTGSINAKVRTLEKKGEIIRVARGVYDLSVNVQKGDLLLVKLKDLIDEFDLSPSQLNMGDNVSNYYNIYGQLKRLYLDNVDYEGQIINDILQEVREESISNNAVFDEELGIKLYSIEISSVTEPLEKDKNKTKQFSFRFLGGYVGEKEDRYETYYTPFKENEVELKEDIKEVITQTVITGRKY